MFADKNHISDHATLRRIKQGQRELIENFIVTYYDEILHFCVYQLHDVDTAFDVTQETFLRFIKNVDNLEYRSIKSYLLTIARNLCVDYWNNQKREQAAAFPENDDNSLFAMQEHNNDSSTLPSEYDHVENNLFLAELLSHLPAEQREIVVLRYYNDLKLSEISKILNLNLSTVKSRLRLGIQRLKQQIDRT